MKWCASSNSCAFGVHTRHLLTWQRLLASILDIRKCFVRSCLRSGGDLSFFQSFSSENSSVDFVFENTMEWSKDWSKQEIDTLIDEYAKYPVLWNKMFSRLQDNKCKRQIALKEISDRLGYSEVDCERKISSLLSSYRREKCRMKKSVCNIEAGKGNKIYQSKWWAFRKFEFLMDKETLNLVRNETKNTALHQLQDFMMPTEPKIEIGEEDENIGSVVGMIKLEDESNDSTTITNLDVDIDRLSNLSAEKANKEEQYVKMEEFLVDERPIDSPELDFSTSHDAADSETDLQADRTADSGTWPPSIDSAEDDVNVFGQYVARKLTGYSKETKVILQYEINNLLFRADMGLLKDISSYRDLASTMAD